MLQEYLNLPDFSISLDKFIEYHEDSIRPLIYLEYTDKTGYYI